MKAVEDAWLWQYWGELDHGNAVSPGKDGGSHSAWSQARVVWPPFPYLGVAADAERRDPVCFELQGS